MVRNLSAIAALRTDRGRPSSDEPDASGRALDGGRRPAATCTDLQNLFSNAPKYTAEGRIGVSMERTQELCVVRINDTGVGIPADMLSRIFDLFTQVDRIVGRSQGGLDVGLTLARRLVELHGGDIEARSEVGRGSRIHRAAPVDRNHTAARDFNRRGALQRGSAKESAGRRRRSERGGFPGDAFGGHGRRRENGL